MQGPKKAASFLLVLIVLAMGFADYWEYSKAFHMDPMTHTDVIAGTAHAPEQYRVGVILPASFVARHTHLALRHVFTAIDTVAGFVTTFVLFFLLRRSRVYKRTDLPARWFGAAAFLLLVQFYLPWVTWYQRPETMTTAALIALSLLLLTVRVPWPGAAGIAATAIGQLGLAAAQGFVRADVAFALHTAVFFVCMTSSGEGMSLPRGVQRVVSGTAVPTAAGIQYFLMHSVYPNATYGDTPVFELLLNFKEWGRLIPFAIFIPPYVWTIRTLWRRRSQVEAPSLALAVGSGIYMAMWWCAGRVEEVRIFLPFALALAPLTAGLAMQWLDTSLAEKLENPAATSDERLFV